MNRHLKDSDRRKNYIILAENSYLDDDKEKAVEFYTKALQFQGSKAENIELLYNMAIIYDESDDPEKAFETYKRVAVLDQNQAGAFYGMATMHERLGNRKGALESYFRAVEIDPEYDRAYFYIANIYDEMGNKEEAICHYKKVLGLRPDDYIAYNNLGSIYEEMGKDDKAYKMLKKSIDLSPNYYKALFNIGVIYKKLGDNQKAIEYYDRSLENEKYSYSYLNKSAIYIEEDRLGDCIELLTEGIHYNPHAEYLYYNRACCYSRLAKFDMAIEDLAMSILLDPGIKELAMEDGDFVNLRGDKRFKALLQGQEEFD